MLPKTRDPAWSPRAAGRSAALLVAALSPALFSQEVKPEDIEAAQRAQFDEIERYLDRKVSEAGGLREASWKRDLSSVKAYEESVEPWRKRLWDLIGGGSYPPAPLDPEERLLAEGPTHRAHRVSFRAFEDVRAAGVLLVPRGEGPFPALICVHGMGGTPEGVCGLTAEADYHNRFGRQAAERGYLVFAPLDMNSQKKRSWLDRKAILVGERLQALEEKKVLRALDYLSERKDVRKERIGAYGISWGGRTVMYLAALDRRVAACAISGHFNDLVPKMLTPSPHTTAYIETAEDYAFFWRHALLFDDADVVSLICPRPVFIEQGSRDRVAHREASERAFAPVREIYRKLGIVDRAEYSVFDGAHEVRGVEAFRFFDRWLKD